MKVQLDKGGDTMGKGLTVSILTLLISGLLALPVTADDSLVAFDGGIGVIPVSRAAGTPSAGVFPDVIRNDVLGIPPGGQPWRIADLSAEVQMNGHITVDGRGLLLAGGNNIGSNGNQMVRARLFCGGIAHNSGLVPLAANGDFRIDDVLDPLPLPSSCDNPVLLIVSGNGNWFAAGIPKTE